MTMYLGTRDIVISDQTPGKLHGVIRVDPESVENNKVSINFYWSFRTEEAPQ